MPPPRIIPIRCADIAENTNAFNANDDASATNCGDEPFAGGRAAPLRSSGSSPCVARPCAGISHQCSGRHTASSSSANAAKVSRQPRSDEAELRQRPEHGARKAAEERERGQRLAIGRAEVLRQRCEGRVVQRQSHRYATDAPGEVILERRRHARQPEQRERRDQRANRQHDASAPAIDRAARHRRGQSGEQQPGRVGAEDMGGRESEIGADRRAEHGDRIVERSPRNDLRDAERGHEPPRIGAAPGGRGWRGHARRDSAR